MAIDLPFLTSTYEKPLLTMEKAVIKAPRYSLRGNYYASWGLFHLILIKSTKTLGYGGGEIHKFVRLKPWGKK